ncbi:MAG: DHH family phosphoesterase [bacterium]|nr:DHH family phosphoesterase [bacterium]
MVIKNLKEAADRIKKAVKNKEKIIIYGDSDLDGVTSVIITKEAVKNLGGLIQAIYFPNRETEGYGLSQTGLNFLKKFSPALLVVLDCGISNFKEVKIAKKFGLEVIIVDHHEILDKLPDVKIIVDPKQKEDKYPFKQFAACGLAFRLAEAILGKKMTENLRKDLIELAALGTIADMMPREDDNAVFILEGLKSLEKSWRPGIKIFLDSLGDSLRLDQKVQKLISVLNARDVENNLPASFRLLTLSSEDETKKLLEKLIEKSDEKKARTEMVLQEAEDRLLGKEEKIIFEGSESWDYGLISTVASLLVNRHQKPTFIFKKGAKESQGTVRMPKHTNAVSLMKQCKKLLLTYGGHPMAAGFRIKNENLKEFKKCLIKNYQSR